VVGVTLVDIRERIESLAVDDGDYVVVCARTGDRPVPVAGTRFDRRTTARDAVEAAERYRATLRRYDPHLPVHDLIVSQEPGPGPRRAERRVREPGADPPPGQRADADFCHAVAAAVFETLSAGGYDAVERGIVDAYLELAERVGDPDDLCLRLLESTATELDARLSPGEQADVLAEAAGRSPPSDPSPTPVPAALSGLCRHGLVDDYARSPWSVDADGVRRSVDVHLSGYALAPRRGRLPVVPLVVELYRRRPGWEPTALRVVDADDGWRARLVLAPAAEPGGLAAAPIEPEVG
jgi:hypothetical protein